MWDRAAVRGLATQDAPGKRRGHLGGTLPAWQSSRHPSLLLLTLLCLYADGLSFGPPAGGSNCGDDHKVYICKSRVVAQLGRWHSTAGKSLVVGSDGRKLTTINPGSIPQLERRSSGEPEVLWTGRVSLAYASPPTTLLGVRFSTYLSLLKVAVMTRSRTWGAHTRSVAQ